MVEHMSMRMSVHTSVRMSVRMSMHMSMHMCLQGIPYARARAHTLNALISAHVDARVYTQGSRDGTLVV